MGFRSQAMAEDAFKKLEQAHRTVSDPKLRDEYDYTLPAAHFSRAQPSRSAYGAYQRAPRSNQHYKWE